MQVVGVTAAAGAERFAVNLALEQQRVGHSAAVFALSNRTDALGSTMRQSLQAAAVSFAHGPADRVRIGAVTEYARAVRAFRPQIVHLHTENTEIAHALARRLLALKVPAIRTVHTTRLRSDWLARWAIRDNALPLSALCSPAIDFSTYDGRTKTRLIPNGVSFDWPITDAGQRRQARLRLGIDPRRHIFLHVGRLDGESLKSAPKAHDCLIEAWRRAAVRERADLHLLGDGVLRPALQRLAAGDTSIHFHGVRNDVHDWLLAADVFVLPSRYEGLPIAAIEAVGSGLPALFSDIPELRALDAPAARLVTADDVTSIRQGLETVLDDCPAPDIDLVEKFRKRFSIAACASRYDDCYRDILGFNLETELVR